MIHRAILSLSMVIAAFSASAQLSPTITSWQQNTTEIGFAEALINVQPVDYLEI